MTDLPIRNAGVFDIVNALLTAQSNTSETYANLPWLYYLEDHSIFICDLAVCQHSAVRFGEDFIEQDEAVHWTRWWEWAKNFQVQALLMPQPTSLDFEVRLALYSFRTTGERCMRNKTMLQGHSASMVKISTPMSFCNLDAM